MYYNEWVCHRLLYKVVFCGILCAKQKTMKTSLKLLVPALVVLSFLNLNAQDNKNVISVFDDENTLYLDESNNHTVNHTEEEVTFIIGEEPNSFSPNSDGINDYFEINYLNNFTEEITSQIFIFNASGHIVWQSNDTHASQLSWNGNIQGSHNRPAAEGTYYYVLLIECKGQILRRTGFIELRR